MRFQLDRPAAKERLPRTKTEIERLVVAELRNFAECEDALQVVVVPIVDQIDPATWTISCFNPGTSDDAACDDALQHIVPFFQRVYDLVQKH